MQQTLALSATMLRTDRDRRQRLLATFALGTAVLAGIASLILTALLVRPGTP